MNMDIVTPFDPKMLLRSKADVGILSADVAGEGERVLMSDGEAINWTPPPVKPVIPDWSGIKSIRKYFGRTGMQPYPAWLYHPAEAARVVKNAEEAAELGIGLREATNEEKGRYGVKSVWDWTPECKWRPQPYPGTVKFDPRNPGPGKEYVPAAPDPRVSRDALLEAVIPQVTAAVVAALKSSAPAAPAHIDAREWNEFQAFLAFKKTTEAVDLVGQRLDEIDEEEANGNALNAAAARGSDERAEWEAEATRKGVKIDRRWSVERLKTEVEKVA